MNPFASSKGNPMLQTIVRQVSLILVALGLATVFLAVSGYPPFAILQGLRQSITTDIAGTVRWAAPLIMAGLAISVTYKAEVFNLGVDGQLCLGAAASTAVALYLPVQNRLLALLLVFLAGMIAGMLYAIIPALLKVYLNTNEVVSTLLLNFIAVLFLEYLVTGPLRDTTAGSNLNASAVIPETSWLPRISFLEPSSANIGIYIALIMAFCMAFVFRKTTLGYEIRTVGANAEFAAYGGIKPKKSTIQVMAISGAIAGMIGTVEVTAVQHRLMEGFNPGFGFDGIVVSLLAGNNPFGILFSGAFFGALRNSGANMERVTSVPSAVTKIVTAIIILTISAQFVLPKLKKSWNNTKSTAKEG